LFNHVPCELALSLSPRTAKANIAVLELSKGLVR